MALLDELIDRDTMTLQFLIEDHTKLTITRLKSLF